MTLWAQPLAHFVAGIDRLSRADDLIDLIDPVSGAPMARLPAGSGDVVDLAVDAASAAAPVWAALGPDGRSDVVGEAVGRAAAAADELAAVQCREMGQPWSVARPLVDAVLAGLHGAMEEARAYPFARTIAGDVVAGTDVLRVPRGVGAVISPWNFPLPVAIAGVAGLLAAGNPVVWKPSELSPVSALRLAQLLDLPPGVLNVVLGDERSGRPLVAHPAVRFVVFTGSVSAGREVAQACAQRFCPSLLELGGKDPVVVDADVDVKWAASVVAHGGLWNSGQVCTSMERVYVHRDIASDFLDALASAAEAKVVGAPLDPDTEVGPMVSAGQREIVEQHVADAIRRGAQVVTGGATPAGPGFFFPPTVLTGIVPGMLAHDVETFGPTIGVSVVDSYDEGLRRAAISDYGLCATVLTNDPEHARRGSEIPAAVVWVNEWQGGAPGMLYEPVRSSGWGTTGSLDAFTRPMTLHRGRAAS